MKKVRFSVAGKIHQGIWRHNKRIETPDGKNYPDDQVRWLPPVVPTKVIGLALNYADHAAELNMDPPKDPILFLKPLSSLIGHLEPVHYPHGIQYMHYEVELVVVIAKRCRHVPAPKAKEVIAGYTIGNDITIRDYVENFYRPPIRAKGYDTFGPVGPYLVTPDEIPDLNNLQLCTYINGELRQSGNTGQMIHSVDKQIEFISQIMTLEPGDMIWTGTPLGISHIYPGDVMRLEIDGLGALENEVIADPKSHE